MAKSTISWDQDRLTSAEKETLQELIDKGVEVCAAPVEIESMDQLETLGITKDDLRTWRFGIDRVVIHLTPSDRATSEMLTDDLQKKYCHTFRDSRCRIPGKKKVLIMCPECNKCSACPYPQYRDNQKPKSLSWEVMQESGYEEVADSDPIHESDVKMELEAVCKEIRAKDPRYLEAIVMKHYYQFTVKEIAERMETTESNVYYVISQAKMIGKVYKQNNP